MTEMKGEQGQRQAMNMWKQRDKGVGEGEEGQKSGDRALGV